MEAKSDINTFNNDLIINNKAIIDDNIKRLDELFGSISTISHLADIPEFHTKIDRLRSFGYNL